MGVVDVPGILQSAVSWVTLSKDSSNKFLFYVAAVNWGCYCTLYLIIAHYIFVE